MELANPTYFVLLFFLSITFWLLPFRFRSFTLLLGSYFFYAWWDLRYLPVLLGSTIFDFYMARWIGGSVSPRSRKLMLTLSVIANLSILCVFKYTNFFSSTFQSFFSFSGKTYSEFEPIFLFIPLGISFYTFHSISYVVDVYRRKIDPISSFIEYSVYVTFFPKLISGPIERAEILIPQLRGGKSASLKFFLEAIGLLSIGYFLKLCLADRMGDLTGIIFNHPFSYFWWERWVALYAFSIQIYADFLGYTKIAHGSALLFGIRLSENFRSPYLAENVQDFWRRWHITLSSWFRDYLYIPLGGSRRLPVRNVMITMTLAGFWHGASANFLLWGFYHGLLLVFCQKVKWPKLPVWLKIFFTFHLVSFGWILFQAKSFANAIEFFRSLWVLGSLDGPVGGALQYFLFFLFVAAVANACFRYYEKLFSSGWDRFDLIRAIFAGTLIGSIILLTLFFGAGNANPFVYFQF